MNNDETDDFIAPRGRFETLQELRLPLDALRWAPAWLTSKPVRAARTRTVLLLPGFGAGPRSMRIMEAFLRRRGHHVRDWGLGINRGDVKGLRTQLEPIVAAGVERTGGPLVLVGWSLGGYIAREYAREHAAQVRRVVTLGSPVIGGARHTATAQWYRSQGYDFDEIDRAIRRRYESMPLRVPVTAIYSKRDGIVAWKACIDKWSADVRHLEVDETHVGLVLSPRVLALVAEAIEAD